MTEISLQICHNNSSEGFLSNPLATWLPKFARGVQKQQLPPSFPWTPAACWIPLPTRGCRAKAAPWALWGLRRRARQGDTCMTKRQVLKDSLAGQVSSVLQGSHTWVALPSITAAARLIPFGSSAALVRQHYCCLLWPGGFVSFLQPTHTPVPKQAARGLGDSLACLYWATSCNRGTTWGQQAVHAGEVTQDETLPVKGLIHYSLDVLDSKMERERERGRGQTQAI